MTSTLRTGTALVAAAVIAGAGVAGCGGGGSKHASSQASKRLSSATYVTYLNQAKDAMSNVKHSFGDAHGAIQVKRSLTEERDAWRKAANILASVKPPASAEQSSRRLIAMLRGGAAQLDRDVHAKPFNPAKAGDDFIKTSEPAGSLLSELFTVP